MANTTAEAAASPVKTCKRGHGLVADNLTADGKCKICGRERMRAWKAGVKRDPIPLNTHCANGHEFTPENTYTYRNFRQCNICRKAHVQASWWRNREKRLAESRAWREANIEQHRENARAWAQENRERANLTSKLKKQRRRAAGTLTADDWALVLEVYGSACLACGAPDVTIDHVIPVSKGGLNTIDNVQPLCGRCNSSKGTKTVDYRPVPLADLVA